MAAARSGPDEEELGQVVHSTVAEQKQGASIAPDGVGLGIRMTCGRKVQFAPTVGEFCCERNAPSHALSMSIPLEYSEAEADAAQSNLHFGSLA